MNLTGRNFLTLIDYTPEEIRYLLDLSKDLKDKKKNNIPHEYLKGKNIVLLFEKTSTRTRCAFEVAGRDLGMGVTYLDPGSSQMGKKESISDTAKVLGRMYDGIEYRGFEQSIVETLAENAGVPGAQPEAAQVQAEPDVCLRYFPSHGVYAVRFQQYVPVLLRCQGLHPGHFLHGPDHHRQRHRVLLYVHLPILQPHPDSGGAVRYASAVLCLLREDLLHSGHGPGGGG